MICGVGGFCGSVGSDGFCGSVGSVGSDGSVGSVGCCGLITANVGSSNALWYVHGDVIAQLAKTGTAISITGSHGTSSAYVYTITSTTPGLSVDAFSVYTIRMTTT